MFKKKQTTTPGRLRPSVTPNHRPASVFSYHANRSVGAGTDATRHANEATPGGAVADRKANTSRRAQGVVRVLVLLGVLTLVVLNIIVVPAPQVRIATTTAPDRLFLHPEETYQGAAADILQSSPLNRTKLTIRPKDVAKQLSTQFPELAGVVVSLPFIGQQPTVHIEPAIPALLFAAVDNQVYILDVNGKALASLAQAPSVAKLNLPTVTDQSSLPVRVGTVALPSTNVAFITEVVGQLKAKQLSARSLVLPQGTSELRVQVSGALYAVKFNLHGNARAEVGAYLAVKQQLDKEKKTPAEYIDVRVENRAYYK